MKTEWSQVTDEQIDAQLDKFEAAALELHKSTDCVLSGAKQTIIAAGVCRIRWVR